MPFSLPEGGLRSPRAKIRGEAEKSELASVTLNDRVLLKQTVRRPARVVFGPAERARIKAAVGLPLAIGGPDLEAWWKEVQFAALGFTHQKVGKGHDGHVDHEKIFSAAQKLFGYIKSRLEREPLEADPTPFHHTLISVAVLIEWMKEFGPEPRGKGRPVDYTLRYFLDGMAHLYQTGFAKKAAPSPGPFARFVTAVASEAAPDFSKLTLDQIEHAWNMPTPETWKCGRPT
jgi:hypothetical protein